MFLPSRNLKWHLKHSPSVTNPIPNGDVPLQDQCTTEKNTGNHLLNSSSKVQSWKIETAFDTLPAQFIYRNIIFQPVVVKWLNSIKVVGSGIVFFSRVFLDLLSCPFPLLFAAFWSWKLPFQRHFATFRSSNISFSVGICILGIG